MMAISESVRLVKELYKERIPVRHLFVNQVQVENNHCSFCCARYKEHKANLQYIREQFQGLRITPVQVIVVLRLYGRMIREREYLVF